MTLFAANILRLDLPAGIQHFGQKHFTRHFLHSIGQKTLLVNLCLPTPPSWFKFAVTFRLIVSSNASETNTMRKNIIKITLLAAAIAGTFLVLGMGKSASKAPCEEGLEQCCKKKNRDADANIWETGSGQFFTSFELN